MKLLIKALAFAADKHRNQRRKDVAASPYINHPIALVNVLANEGGLDDERLMVAAVLHDTLEDTRAGGMVHALASQAQFHEATRYAALTVMPLNPR